VVNRKIGNRINVKVAIAASAARAARDASYITFDAISSSDRSIVGF
jgi:hypothetical protein